VRLSEEGRLQRPTPFHRDVIKRAIMANAFDHIAVSQNPQRLNV